MALVSRYMLQLDDPSFVDQGPVLLRDWLRWKRKEGELELPSDNSVLRLDGGADLWIRAGSDGNHKGFRGGYFEQRENEQVRTTFTALDGEGSQWAWIDLERWSDDPYGPGWVPLAPGIVTALLDYGKCFRGGVAFPRRYREIGWKGAERLAEQILDPDREVPIVVATPTSSELEGDLKAARKRASALQRHLKGLAPVVLLKKAGVEGFSSFMEANAWDLGVSDGAIRIFLPGAGSDNDIPARHRLIPYRRISRRPDDAIGRLIALPLMRGACHEPPPPFWVDGLREVMGERGAEQIDTQLEELLELAEEERHLAERRLEDAELARLEIESSLEAERATVAEVLDESDDFRRRLRYAQDQIRKSGNTPKEPSEQVEVPDFCSEVVELVEAHCSGVVVGPSVLEAAEALDEHVEPSWARKAWRAFRAMQAYVETKKDGQSGTDNFLVFCQRGEHPDVIPASWVSLTESASTDTNQQFREQRTFTVPQEVNAFGSIYMAAHIKIERGGSPAPRIHFHDDTDGATSKIHVGWFGRHLDSKAKN